MKLLIFILVLGIAPFTHAQNKITVKEAIAKCKAMSLEQRKNSKMCQLLIQKLKEIKAKKQDSNKCENKKINEKIENLECLSKIEPKELEKNDTSSEYSLYTGYSILGNIQGFNLDVERKKGDIGIGLFFSQQNVRDLNSNDGKGSAFGLGLKYYIRPDLTERFFMGNFSGFAQLGLAEYEIQGQKSPQYIFSNFGLESSFNLLKKDKFNIKGFFRLGINHIYHQESDFINMGNSGSFGLVFYF